MPALGGVNSTTSVATSAELAAHTDDATAAHAASAIAFTPAGTVAATTVQAAIEEVAAEASGSGIPQGGPLTEDLDADSNHITNLPEPTDPSEAVRKDYVDQVVGNIGLTEVLGASNDADGNAITNLADPEDPQDAATKAYVDTGYIPQGGPLTENLASGGHGFIGADHGGGDRGGATVTVGNADANEGGSAFLSGGSDVAAGDGGTIAAAGANGDDGIAGGVTINTGGGSANDARGGDLTVELGEGDGTGRNGQFIIENLPTADPIEADAIWADNGVLVQSGSTAGAGALTSVTIDLDAADIATLSSVPVEVVAAPGAGKVIVPVSASLQYKAGAVAFTNTTDVLLRLATNGVTAGVPVGWDGLTSRVVGLMPDMSADQGDYENGALSLGSDLDPDGAGDGTARLTVLYFVMDLAV